MLRVDVEQAHRHLTQLVEAHRRVVDKGTAASAARELAPQYHLSGICVQIVGLEVAVDVVKARYVKNGLNDRLCLGIPFGAHIGPLAHHQP